VKGGLGWLATLATISLAGVVPAPAAEEAPDPSKGSKGGDKVVVGYRAVIGTSRRVKALAADKAQGAHYHESFKRLLVEEREPPKGCGIRAAQFFRREVLAKFQAASSACSISKDKVSCPTDPLPGYGKLYLALIYERRSDDLDLWVLIKRRGIWGTSDAELSPTHTAWFEGLFDCLVSIAECTDEPPICARRTLAGAAPGATQ
jgi:hypothetical protein